VGREEGREGGRGGGRKEGGNTTSTQQQEGRGGRREGGREGGRGCLKIRTDDLAERVEDGGEEASEEAVARVVLEQGQAVQD